MTAPAARASCKGLSPLEREEHLRHIILTLSDRQDVAAADSPRSQAFAWLVHADAAHVCPDQTIRVIQRYIAALMYYSTKGDTWAECNAESAPVKAPCTSARYLSSESVCSWYKITCDDNGAIIGIITSK